MRLRNDELQVNNLASKEKQTTVLHLDHKNVLGKEKTA